MLIHENSLGLVFHQKSEALSICAERQMMDPQVLSVDMS